MHIVTSITGTLHGLGIGKYNTTYKKFCTRWEPQLLQNRSWVIGIVEFQTELQFRLCSRKISIPADLVAKNIITAGATGMNTNTRVLSINVWQFCSTLFLITPISRTWHECTWSWIVSKNLSLNWNAKGNCCCNCQTLSKNCVNTGETSLPSLRR